MCLCCLAREHNTASSQENTNPSLPPNLGSLAQAPSRSPSLPPGTNWNQGSASSTATTVAASALVPSNNSNASTHGYLTPGRPSPLNSPLTAAPTSFMSPRVPLASPGLGGSSPRIPGNPFSPSTPGLHSPVGGGDSSGGGASSGSFFLASPAAQGQSKPSTEEDSAAANARPNQPSHDSNGAGTAEASNAPSPRPPNPSPAPQCPASHSTLTERHKILHRLLQDTSPNEGSAANEDSAGRAPVEVKKEPPASPATASATPKSREPQDHQLLRFLLDTDEKVLEVLI